MGCARHGRPALILPDVNVLVYAFRREAEQHAQYARWLAETIARDEIALCESTVVGFVRITTNPRIFADPAPTTSALGFVDALLAAPRARWIAPTPATWERMRRICDGDRHVRGALIPDAWLASLAIAHGCTLASADRGFARFEDLDWSVPVAP